MSSSNSPFITYDPSFNKVLGDDPSFDLVIKTNAHEGPVYVNNENALYFTTAPVDTDIPIAEGKENKIMRLDLSSYESCKHLSNSDLTTIKSGQDSNMANGMVLNLDGSLLVCEQGSKTMRAQLSRINLQTLDKTTVVDEWRHLTFNSLNDVVVKSDGTIWFTDPSYGYYQGFKNKPLLGNFVYCYDPKTQQIKIVADNFNRPNGLAFSPDESLIYITDSGALQGSGNYHVDLPHHIRQFNVSKSNTLFNDQLFAVVSPGIPDGIKIDTQGNVYTSSASGVQVYNPSATLIGEIIAPGVANFTFGGKANNTIFILTDDAIWAANISAIGV